VKYFIAIFITAVIVFLGATIYYKGLPSFPSYNKTPVSTESGVTEVSSSPTPVMDESSAIAAAIKAALIAKHGPNASALNITVSKINGDYAQGGASAEGGGAMWFAAKVDGIWKLVWDGNGTISCSDFVSYPDFPKTMLSECWDETKMKNVPR
jgi:hypothetical protein